MTTAEAQPEAQPAKPRMSYLNRKPTGYSRVMEQHDRETGLVVMMSEVQDGVFVGWDICQSCSTHIRKCQCADGPIEPPYVQKWRSARGPTDRPRHVDSDTHPNPAVAADVGF